MSSRHALGEGSAHQFRIVIKTIAGKRYEITELEGWFYVEVLKTILMYKIDPRPGVGRMRLMFENNMLDDLKRLSEYNICEGSELDLVLLAPLSSDVDDEGEEPKVWDDEGFRLVVNTITGKRYEIIDLNGTDTVGLINLLLRYKIVPKPRESMMRLSFGNIVLDGYKRLGEYGIRQGSELDLVLLTPPSNRSRSASRERSRRREEIYRVRGALLGLDRCREV
jgi:hypothetical protein